MSQSVQRSFVRIASTTRPACTGSSSLIVLLVNPARTAAASVDPVSSPSTLIAVLLLLSHSSLPHDDAIDMILVADTVYRRPCEWDS